MKWHKCILLCVWVFTAGSPAQTQEAGPLRRPATISLCEIARTAHQFDGQIVAVRGSVLKGWLRPKEILKQFVITEPEGVIACPGIRMTVVLPSTAKPKPELELLHDESFRTFEKALHQRTSIEGTFQGLFSHNNQRKLEMQLIVQRVSDLDIHPTGHMDH